MKIRPKNLIFLFLGRTEEKFCFRIGRFLKKCFAILPTRIKKAPNRLFFVLSDWFTFTKSYFFP